MSQQVEPRSLERDSAARAGQEGPFYGPFAGALGWQGASRMGRPVCMLVSNLAVAASRSAELR